MYIFGDDNAGFAPLTTDTMLAAAYGEAQSSLAAKDWGVINGSAPNSFVDTGIALTTGTIYHFTFLIDAANHRYKAALSDGQSGAGHTFISDWLGWDNDNVGSKTYIEAGARMSDVNESISYSMDRIAVMGPSFPTSPTSPDAPSGLFATAVDDADINVSWNAVAGATSYHLERSRDGSTGWQEITSGNFTSFSDSGLLADTDYFYRVRAEADGTFSDYSQVVDATTQSPIRPNAPAGL